MTEGVERFEYLERLGVVQRGPQGEWVRYSDYEKEKARREETESAYTSLCHELARLLGPIKPRMGTTTNGQLIAKVGQVLIERDQARNQERQRIEELERELEDLKAQGAACAEAIVGAEAILTGFDAEELEKLGLTVPEEISNAGIVLTETLEALRAIEPGIVDRACQSERQRIQEALERVDSFWPEQVTARTDEQDQWIRQKEALAALDTLDPSGEESDGLEATLDDMASAIGQAPFIGPNQGREPDEAAYERAKALREREPGIVPLSATDTSKEEDAALGNSRRRAAQKRHEDLNHSASESYTRCPDPVCQRLTSKFGLRASSKEVGGDE